MSGHKNLNIIVTFITAHNSGLQWLISKSTPKRRKRKIKVWETIFTIWSQQILTKLNMEMITNVQKCAILKAVIYDFEPNTSWESYNLSEWRSSWLKVFLKGTFSADPFSSKIILWEKQDIISKVKPNTDQL